MFNVIAGRFQAAIECIFYSQCLKIKTNILNYNFDIIKKQQYPHKLIKYIFLFFR